MLRPASDRMSQGPVGFFGPATPPYVYRSGSPIIRQETPLGKFHRHPLLNLHPFISHNPVHHSPSHKTVIPIPKSQISNPNSQFPIPNSQFPNPKSQIPNPRNRQLI